MKINELLKTSRKKQGISQRELGKKLKYTTGQFIYHWEMGRSMPPLDKVKKICSILDIQIPEYKKAYFSHLEETFKKEVLNEK